MLNYAQITALFAANGAHTPLLVTGEMGIGKTSALQGAVSDARFTCWPVYTFDCAARSEGDLGLPWSVEIDGKRVTDMAPSKLLGMHQDRPAVIVFDELTKASEGVRQMVTPLLLERRFNDRYLHPQTLIGATGNLPSEGLGDVLPPHAANRMQVVRMRKPRLVDDADQPVEWLADFALPRGAPASVIGFCRDTPQIFADYVAGTDNPFIHDPRRVQDAFCTPRSFTKMVFGHLPNRHLMDTQTFREGCAGLVGEATANGFFVYLTIEDALPSVAQVRAAPLTVPWPKSPLHQVMLVYKLAYGIDPAASLAEVINYLRRGSEEYLALFAHIVTHTPRTMGLIGKLYALGVLKDAADLRSAV